jgi:hypothetical protein
MKRTGLIRLAGLAAMTGGGVYAASGLITLPIVPSLFGGNIIAENLPFALLLVGAAASIVALHVLHKDLPRDRYGPLGLLASVMAVAGAGLLLVGGSAIFLGLLLVTGGLVALAVVTMGAGWRSSSAIPCWCCWGRPGWRRSWEPRGRWWATPSSGRERVALHRLREYGKEQRAGSHESNEHDAVRRIRGSRVRYRRDLR